LHRSGNVIPPWTIIVVGGILKLNETLKRQEKGVENIRIHPKFNLENLYNDVAVLKVLVQWFINQSLSHFHVTFRISVIYVRYSYRHPLRLLRKFIVYPCQEAHRNLILFAK